MSEGFEAVKRWTTRCMATVVLGINMGKWSLTRANANWRRPK